MRSHEVLRLRLRDLQGNVVFSDDGSGFTQRPEDEALDAAQGHVVARLTHLNSDANDTGPIGPLAVEVYVPLVAGAPLRRVGVLEVYLPYAPINADVSAGLSGLYRDLALGLGALYVALFAISVSVTRRLRRQLRVNTYLAEHDALTDLPNRVVFQQARRGGDRRGRAQRTCRSCVAIVDLDRFKEINDTLGHHNGDALLAELAVRLVGPAAPRRHGRAAGRRRVRPRAARLRRPRGRAVAPPQGRRARGARERALPVRRLVASATSWRREDGADVDELLQRAEVAMYAAKARHAGVLRYDLSQDLYDAAEPLPRRRAAPGDRRGRAGAALPAQGPRSATAASTRSRRSSAGSTPTLGLLAPDRFVPLAEQSDLIDRLTEWVVHRALTDVCDLQVRLGARLGRRQRLGAQPRPPRPASSSSAPSSRRRGCPPSCSSSR